MKKSTESLIYSIILLIFSIIGGVLGRLGGSSQGNRLFRLLGVPGCCCALLIIMYHPLEWLYYGAILLTFGLVLGTTSTYWKKKGSDALWFNWMLYGGMEGLAFLPITIYTRKWIGYAIRTVVCSVLICLWDEYVANFIWKILSKLFKTLGEDVVAEFGRYFIIVLTTPLALI